MTLATDEQKQAVRRKQEKLELEQQRSDIAWVMNDPRGRRVMRAVLDECGIYNTTMSVDETGRVDPYRVVNREGGRNVGLWLVAQLLDANPELWLEMERESVVDEQERKEAS